MQDDASIMTAEINALTDAYAALNRNDIAGFVACFDPQIRRIEPPGFPSAGTYDGLKAVKAHIAQGRSTWADGECRPTRFIATGNHIVVMIHVHVRLKNATSWIDAQIADVFTFRNGKAVEFRTFGKVKDAKDFTGVALEE